MSRDRDDESLFGFGRAVLDRLDRIIELLEDRGRDAEDSSAPRDEEEIEPGSSRGTAGKSNTSVKKLRGVSPAAFRLYGSKVLAALLAEKSDVGKLTISLERENDIRHAMLAAVLRVLEEQGVIRISEAPRGQARYVRLVDVKLAEERLEELREELREEARARLKALGE